MGRVLLIILAVLIAANVGVYASYVRDRTAARARLVGRSKTKSIDMTGALTGHLAACKPGLPVTGHPLSACIRSMEPAEKTFCALAIRHRAESRWFAFPANPAVACDGTVFDARHMILGSRIVCSAGLTENS
jgi:hypothetical protein